MKIEKSNLINPVIWALLILATAYLMQGIDSNKQFMLMMLQITGFIVTDGLIRAKSASKNADNE